MSEFDKEVFGYDIPDDIPQQVEGSGGFEYYKHPVGLYFGFCGKLNFKYVGQDKKPCNPDDVGARLSHAILPLWISQFHGTTINPVTEVIVDANLKLPTRPLAECYYPVRVAFAPEEIWKNKQLFGSWFVPNNPALTVIGKNPSKPNIVVVNYKAFPAYYGVGVRWSIVHSDKGNAYVDGKKDQIGLMLDKRIPLDKMLEFEKAVEIKTNAERMEREANKSQQQNYQPEAPPATNFDELAGSESDDLGSFING